MSTRKVSPCRVCTGTTSPSTEHVRRWPHVKSSTTTLPTTSDPTRLFPSDVQPMSVKYNQAFASPDCNIRKKKTKQATHSAKRYCELVGLITLVKLPRVVYTNFSYPFCVVALLKSYCLMKLQQELNARQTHPIIQEVEYVTYTIKGRLTLTYLFRSCYV